MCDTESLVGASAEKIADFIRDAIIKKFEKGGHVHVRVVCEDGDYFAAISSDSSVINGAGFEPYSPSPSSDVRRRLIQGQSLVEAGVFGIDDRQTGQHIKNLGELVGRLSRAVVDTTCGVEGCGVEIKAGSLCLVVDVGGAGVAPRRASVCIDHAQGVIEGKYKGSFSMGTKIGNSTVNQEAPGDVKEILEDNSVKGESDAG